MADAIFKHIQNNNGTDLKRDTNGIKVLRNVIQLCKPTAIVSVTVVDAAIIMEEILLCRTET